MKNKNVLKLALIGALIGIVLFDIINIALYLTEGFCVKIENTGSLIAGYISAAIFTAALVILYFNLKKIEMSNKSTMKKGLYMFLYTVIMLLIFEGTIILQEEVFKSEEVATVLILVDVVATMLGGVIQMIAFAKNKGNVKEINKKIKEWKDK